jgi:hypothetical protein
MVAVVLLVLWVRRGLHNLGIEAVTEIAFDAWFDWGHEISHAARKRRLIGGAGA